MVRKPGRLCAPEERHVEQLLPPTSGACGECSGGSREL